MNRKIIEELNELKQNLEHKGPWIAAFDADGTLWDTDMGENFFEYQIESKALDLPQDPWKHYNDLKKIDAPTAYLWLAQINAGQKLSTVQNWAEDSFLKNEPTPFFESQKQLIELLHKNDVEVYIVTASIKWAVEPGARRLGVPESHVIGVKTKIHGDSITDQCDGPITYREGKVQGLLQATSGIRPIFCSGNTLGDQQLLESSSGLRLAVQSKKPGAEIYETEIALQQIAKNNGWLTANFSR
jgi:phosphoserine phosphatase